MIGFLGPWFCSLFFNTSSNCKKQTHLEAHTYPHLAEDALNKGIVRRANDGEDNCWISILKVGPFEKWDHAVTFRDLWASHTRGKLFRLERGLLLFKTYREQYGLTLWAQTEFRAEAIRRFFDDDENRETLNETSGASLLPLTLGGDDEDAAEGEALTFEKMFSGGDLENATVGIIDGLREQIEKASSAHNNNNKRRKVAV